MELDIKGRTYLEILKLQLKSFHISKENLYFTMLQVFLLKSTMNFVIYLSSVYYIEVWDLSDKTVGYLISLGSLQIFFTFAAGNIIDRIGIKNAYILIAILGFITYSLLLFVKNLIFHVILITCFLGFVMVLTFTNLKTDTTLSTDINNRSFSFSMLNAATQVSSIVYGGGIKLIFHVKGVNTTSFNIIFAITVTFFIISLVLTLLFYKKGESLDAKSWNSFNNIKEAINMKRFWKLLAVNLISSIPLSVIYLIGIMLPIYMSRELDAESNYGLIILGYSLCVIFFCFVFSPIFTYLPPYTFLIISSGILAIAPLVFAIGSGYLAIFAYVFISAFGSSIFESRITEYHGIASMPGMKGTYICLINVSYSMAFIITGMSSGYTLDAFCPDDGQRDCWKMWAISSGIGSVGTLLLLIFREKIEYKYDHEEVDPYVYSKDKY